jgi:DNA-binding IclR family transcriptional regulator
MPRPALSAARGLDVLDLLAATPGQGLTMSDIARATGINVASCHAVLTVLVDRGYLVRDGHDRRYRLGPAIHAAGQAALACQPLLAEAEAAARGLSAELELPVMMSAAIGGDIVGIVSVGAESGRTPLLRTGERRPRRPPIGAPFVAWSGDEAIGSWLADAAPEARPDLRRAADLIRERGFEVLVRSPQVSRRASQLLALAAPGFHPVGPDMALPDTIEPDRLYDVTMIAAPIFDRHGACAFNLCLGPFDGELSGRAILDHADRLLETCVQIMRADRSRS